MVFRLPAHFLLWSVFCLSPHCSRALAKGRCALCAGSFGRAVSVPRLAFRWSGWAARGSRGPWDYFGSLLFLVFGVDGRIFADEPQRCCAERISFLYRQCHIYGSLLTRPSWGTVCDVLRVAPDWSHCLLPVFAAHGKQSSTVPDGLGAVGAFSWVRAI